VAALQDTPFLRRKWRFVPLFELQKEIVVEIPDSMMAIGNSIEGLIHDIFCDKQMFIKESSLLSNTWYTDDKQQGFISSYNLSVVSITAIP
jgi:hypothetical protein